MVDLLDDELVQGVLGLIAAAGAANWAFEDLFEYNLLTDLLDLEVGATEYSVAVTVIAVVALLLVLSLFDGVTSR